MIRMTAAGNTGQQSSLARPYNGLGTIYRSQFSLVETLAVCNDKDSLHQNFTGRYRNLWLFMFVFFREGNARFTHILGAVVCTVHLVIVGRTKLQASASGRPVIHNYLREMRSTVNSYKNNVIIPMVSDFRAPIVFENNLLKGASSEG